MTVNEIENICMNPNAKSCESCIFGSGPTAKWCTPAEKIAKQEYMRILELIPEDWR